MRLLASCWPFLLGLVFAKENTKIPAGCGGWQHCMETHRDSEVPLVWFDAWNSTIQPKLDQLLVTSAGQPEGGWSEKNGLMLVMAGDSTVIQQFQLLSELVRLRNDFQPVTGPDAHRRQNYELTFGAPKMTTGSVTFVFYRVFEACMLEIRNPHVKTAHALYFGCGMHLLHLIPTQSPALLKVALRSWTNYADLLTSRVEGYREVNPGIKLVYMTTHAIQESKYFGPWQDALKGYAERDPAYLDACTKKFHEDLPEGSPTRSNIEQACVDSVFGARGVELLNERGISAMQNAGVAMVPAHGLVAGQAWATAFEDGRHYPHLVPLELFLFLNTIEGLP